MNDETTQPASTTNSVDLEALLNATQLQAQLQQHQQQQQQGFNPLSMLALTSSLQQTNPITQNIARMLLTMNMGQLLATQQTSELLMSLSTQQDTLLAAIARGGANAAGAGAGLAALTAPQLVQGSGGSGGGFAMPQAVGHMSLKRTLPAGAAQMMQQQQPDRKKSCPPLPQPPAPARTPTPPLKKMLSNLTEDQKKKNEMFRKEVMKRLDIILLEELGADDEDEKKDELVDDEDQEEKKESEEDVVVDEPAASLTMGEEGSAFRRILSRSSTLKESSGTTSPTTTGTGSGLSTAPNSPPIESDDVLTTAELLEKIGELGKKHRKERLGNLEDVVKEESDLDEDGFVKYFPPTWTGNLSMKSSETTVRLHFISGNREAIESVLGADESDSKRETIKINQRLRMDNSQLGHVTRLLTDNDYSCCLAIASAADASLLQANNQKLQTNFIDYLANKSIAGISTLGEEMEGKLKGGRVHVMPPCEIVTSYMTELAPNLHEYLSKRPASYLLLIFSSSESAEA